MSSNEARFGSKVTIGRSSFDVQLILSRSKASGTLLPSDGVVESLSEGDMEERVGWFLIPGRRSENDRAQSLSRGGHQGIYVTPSHESTHEKEGGPAVAVPSSVFLL